MSKNFKSLCYIRIYSDIEKNNINNDLWKTISLRDGSGFNYVTRRLFFDIDKLGIAINKLISEYEESYSNIFKNNDVGEIYIWINKSESFQEINGAELPRETIFKLAELRFDLIFSVEESFPDHNISDFKLDL
jgi:hypothetical protein